MMAEGRLAAEWNQTSAILATILNSAAFRKKGPGTRPGQLNPFSDEFVSGEDDDGVEWVDATEGLKALAAALGMKEQP